jgi:hypothetical protein
MQGSFGSNDDFGTDADTKDLVFVALLTEETLATPEAQACDHAPRRRLKKKARQEEACAPRRRLKKKTRPEGAWAFVQNRSILRKKPARAKTSKPAMKKSLLCIGYQSIVCCFSLTELGGIVCAEIVIAAKASLHL